MERGSGRALDGDAGEAFIEFGGIDRGAAERGVEYRETAVCHRLQDDEVDDVPMQDTGKL